MRKIALAFIAVVLMVFSSPPAFSQKKTDKPKSTVVPGVPLAPAVRTVPAIRLEAAAPASVLQYVPDDVVIVGAVQPARVINSKGLQGLFDATKGQDVLEEILQQGLKQTGFDPASVQEIAVILDRQTVDQAAARVSRQAQDAGQLNNLKQVGLAMHNFHDVHSSFPDDDGINGNKGNLSWRVHLLPYLEQSGLYEQFHLDEPWDSAHNKTLIEKMPDVFQSPDVKEPGKTAMHVLAGEGMPFEGDQPLGIARITDGTSNTIMTLIAGSDKAEAWTKPGGLKIDADAPAASLGKIGDRIGTVFMDGAARFLDSNTAPNELLHLMQHQDGTPVNVPFETYGPSVEPGLAIRCSAAIDQKGVLQKLFPFAQDGEPVMIEGSPAKALNGGMFVVFPNPQTMLIGSETTLKQMLGKRVKSGETRARFEELYSANDLAVAADMKPLQEHLPNLLAGMPMAGMVQSLERLSLTIDLTGPGKSLDHISLVMDDKKVAQQLAAMATGLYQMQKAEILAVASADNSPISAEMSDILAAMMDSTAIKADGVNVLVDTPKPEDPGALLKQFEPAFAEVLKGVRAGREVANRSQKLNQLKQLALALHNYHDTYSGLPSFNTGRADEGKNKGLSWRVHILTFLEESALYGEFHLDEPWDSDHNKTLIERMPQIFACEGVEKPGHTAFHVFTGPGTPLGAEKPQGFRDIVDGMSNTIMVVQGGSDTAEVWTKPSGLKFDPKNPKKILGKIGEKFMVVLCDGSARYLSREIDDETLSNLIQHADGNPLGAF